MQPTYTASTPGASALPPALRKLQRLAMLMRLASVAYAAWVLWNMLDWWLDADQVIQRFGKFIERDLSALSVSQRLGALGLDFITWLLLVMAVVHCWKFLRWVGQATLRGSEAASHLSRCAWFAIACETSTLLLRPLKTYLLTSHLPVAERVWQWSFRSADLQSALLCLALLMFAYVFTWTTELAEENRSFV
jgi:hypothetical protein